MKSYEFLFWAYNVIWACLSGFLLFLIMRLKRMDRRLDSVEKAMGTRSDGD